MVSLYYIICLINFILLMFIILLHQKINLVLIENNERPYFSLSYKNFIPFILTAIIPIVHIITIPILGGFYCMDLLTFGHKKMIQEEFSSFDKYMYNFVNKYLVSCFKYKEATDV